MAVDQGKITEEEMNEIKGLRQADKGSPSIEE